MDRRHFLRTTAAVPLVAEALQRYVDGFAIRARSVGLVQVLDPRASRTR